MKIRHKEEHKVSSFSFYRFATIHCIVLDILLSPIALDGNFIFDFLFVSFYFSFCATFHTIMVHSRVYFQFYFQQNVETCNWMRYSKWLCIATTITITKIIFFFENNSQMCVWSKEWYQEIDKNCIKYPSRADLLHFIFFFFCCYGFRVNGFWITQWQHKHIYIQ